MVGLVYFQAVDIAVFLLLLPRKGRVLKGNEGYYFRKYENTLTDMKWHDGGE